MQNYKCNLLGLDSADEKNKVKNQNFISVDCGYHKIVTGYLEC